MDIPKGDDRDLLDEILEASSSLVWYSTSQIEAGQHINDNGSYGDRPWPISKATGEFLNTFIQEKNISSIVELGTGIGYSTIWMAIALKKQENGIIYTIENKEYKSEIASGYFKKAKVESTVKMYTESISTALPKIITTLNSKPIDLLFFYANRSRFEEYLNTLSPIIGTETYLIVDNTIDMQSRLENFKKILVQRGWKIETLEIGDGLWVCKK